MIEPPRVEFHLPFVACFEAAGFEVDRKFFRQGPKKRGLMKGKKWRLLSRWKNKTRGSHPLTERSDVLLVFSESLY